MCAREKYALDLLCKSQCQPGTMLSPCDQRMAMERRPFPNGGLQWRENSAETPNKITITTKHLTSCLHTNMKINTSKAELLNLITKF